MKITLPQLSAVLISLTVISHVTCDVYLHIPRGSNDRLNEKSANRNNANRLFDSQNNNRGGYNVGDLTDRGAGNDKTKQYNMKYFQSDDSGGESLLSVEWTNQHGCGGNEDTDPHKMNCNIVLQYMCQDISLADSKDTTRDGTFTQTQDFKAANKLTETVGQAAARKNNAVKNDRGLQETWEWYDACYMRERNKGLFTADQKLKSDNGLGVSSATYTRQNPNGNRYGYECPEERDYYPYWHPTPWKDIAVLAENASMCSSYAKKSYNVQPYHQCVEYYTPGGKRKHWSKYNNEKECTDNGGKWVLLHNYLEKSTKGKAACQQTPGHIWGVPYDAEDVTKPQCLVALPTPECKEAPWSRSNHLGNGRDGAANTYSWKLPYFPSNKDYNCVFRMRYNISTDDYDPYNTDSRHNEDVVKMVQSPVEQNPYVEIGAGHTPLRLAINTAQFGRTFQDRSHLFQLRKRPANLKGKRIINLNVRGKRGNIVQVYPAVEYDFVPNELTMTENDAVHIQWTGSNTHNNGNPAGDGQAGDAGEGTGGTDRSNIVQIPTLNDNFPMPFEHTDMWTNAEVLWTPPDVKLPLTAKDLALQMSSAGYYKCEKSSKCTKDSVDRKGKMQNQLNNAPASFEGAVLKFKKGTYYYMCSRNNNFTNRSQKGKIVVK